MLGWGKRIAKKLFPCRDNRVIHSYLHSVDSRREPARGNRIGLWISRV